MHRDSSGSSPGSESESRLSLIMIVPLGLGDPCAARARGSSMIWAQATASGMMVTWRGHWHCDCERPLRVPA